MRNRALSEKAGLFVLGFGLVLNSYSQSFLTNGLVAYYPFHGDATDASGNGNDGAIVIAFPGVGGLPDSGFTATTNQVGVTNGALYFPGRWFAVPYTAMAYVSVTPTPFNVHGDWTLSFFCISDNRFENAIFLSTGPNDPYEVSGINMGCAGSAQPPWQLVTGGDDLTVPNTATNDPTQWNMFTCVHSGTLVEMFLNDEMVGSNQTTAVTADRGSLWFGCNQPLAGFALSGAMSDVRIYNRGLFPAEVAQLYRYETTPPGTPQATAIAFTAQGRHLVLSWSGSWVLQSRGTLDQTTAWADVPSAASPYAAPLPSQGQQYYRLRNP